MDALNEKIAKEEQIIKDNNLAEERANALRSKEKDLAAVQDRASKAQGPPDDSRTSPPQKGIFDRLSSAFGHVLGSSEQPLPHAAPSDATPSKTISQLEHTHI